MNLLNRLESGLAAIIDDETLVRQLLASYIPATFTTIFALFWTVLFFVAELPALGRILAVYTIVALLATLLAALRPQYGILSSTSLGLAGILSNLAAHVVIGGFGAGMWFLPWIVVLPISVYLSGARREGVVVLVVALLAAVAAAVLEPRLAPRAAVPLGLQIGYNTFVLITSVTLIFLWGVYVIQQVDRARQRADSLLLNILPAPIAAQLKLNPSTIAQGYDEVTVLFADIVNFTPLSADVDPVAVVSFLNELFSEFDEMAARHGLEKIKTIGDAYMVAGGLPTPRPDHCEAVVAFALEMLAHARTCPAWNGQPVRLRVGINTGPVVAGVIGRQKFIYDLWGDAVNTASRMEAYGEPDAIQVTQAVRDRLAGRYTFEARPPIYIKGKGEMVTYILRSDKI